jgi:polysaccharide deacetylase family sporulation protein PdaB
LYYNKRQKLKLREVKEMGNRLAIGILFIFVLTTGCGKQTTETTAANADNFSTGSGNSQVANASLMDRKGMQAAVVNDVSNAGQEVALTFDDGPDDKYTPLILDILKKYKIKATFFVVGDHVQKYPEMIKRISEEGHVIGNHSWDHADLVKLQNNKIEDEIINTDELVKRYTGRSPTLFRAPYGALSPDVIRDATSSGHQIIGWSVDTLDWDGKSVQQIVNNVKKEVHPGAIILQHCAGGKHGNLNNTVQALPMIISFLKQKGYSFVTVNELISAKAQ